MGDLKRYDVALWLWWPSPFPEYITLTLASSPFAAIRSVMGVYGLTEVPHGAANALDGSIRYCACRVRLLPDKHLQVNRACQNTCPSLSSSLSGGGIDG